jgi:large subunit ribosomal protein L24
MSGRVRLMKILSAPSPGKRRPKSVAQAAATKARWNVVRGDRVQVIGDHPERGKQGKVLQVFRKTDRVRVEGIHVARSHIKGNPDRGIPGRTVQKERTIPYHNVNLVDPVTNKATRISYSFLEDGTKVRVAKKSGAVIPRPEILKYRKRPLNSIVTESDTLEEDVWAMTFEEYPPSSTA